MRPELLNPLFYISPKTFTTINGRAYLRLRHGDRRARKASLTDHEVISAPDRENGNLNILAVFLDDICRYFGQGLEYIWGIFGRFLEGILRGFKG